jgi:hypothetical protein
MRRESPFSFCLLTQSAVCFQNMCWILGMKNYRLASCANRFFTASQDHDVSGRKAYPASWQHRAHSRSFLVVAGMLSSPGLAWFQQFIWR